MNERIAQLARDVGLISALNAAPNRPDIEKFAELIVEECAKVSEDDITDGDACCTNTASRIARQIKKHFGVDE